MGRSFSVNLFCLAMDPLFTYLNRIPGLISVQGYVDDTTIAGDAQNLEWLTQVAECYSNLRTAGFVVDPHSCFRACLTIHNRLQPCGYHSGQIESQWPGLLSSEPYPTVLAALNANCRPGYNTAVVDGAPFSQLHKDTGIITRTGQLMQLYKPKQIQTKQRQQQIPNSGGREDETDARAVRPNPLARWIE